MIAKYDIDPANFYFDATLTTAQISALATDVNRNKRTESQKKIKSINFLCIGDEAQRIFKARQSGMDIKA